MGSYTVFQNFDFFIVKISIFIWDFWVIFENWAYEEKISSHTEHTRNKFSRMLSQR